MRRFATIQTVPHTAIGEPPSTNSSATSRLCARISKRPSPDSYEVRARIRRCRETDNQRYSPNLSAAGSPSIIECVLLRSPSNSSLTANAGPFSSHVPYAHRCSRRIRSTREPAPLMATLEIERGASPRRGRAIRRQERASVVRSEADYAPRFQKKAEARPRTPTSQPGAILVPCLSTRAGTQRTTRDHSPRVFRGNRTQQHPATRVNTPVRVLRIRGSGVRVPPGAPFVSGVGDLLADLFTKSAREGEAPAGDLRLS